MRLWHKYKEPERGENNSMFSGETRGSRRSGVSGASSRLSTVSRKKEKLAPAQLNLRQLNIRNNWMNNSMRSGKGRERKSKKFEEKESYLKLRWKLRGQQFRFRLTKKLINHKKTLFWSTWSLLHERMKSQTACQC